MRSSLPCRTQSPSNTRCTGPNGASSTNYTRADVRAALRDGEIIERYEDTGRGPSYLLLHWIDNRPLHVVAADKAKEEKTVVVTLYDPQTRADKWTDDYRRRT
jgi:hypothetical protein